MRTNADRMAQKARWRSDVSLLYLFVIPLILPLPIESKTAQQFLAEAVKPRFNPGHKLPPLTHWGWPMPFDIQVPLCEDWGYALEFGAANWSTVNNLDNTNSVESKICALTASAPHRYPLFVYLHRPFLESAFVEALPEATWCHDAGGGLITMKTYSPEMPDSNYSQAGSESATSLTRILQVCPISIILNGGEYGLDVYGWAGSTWIHDPIVVNAKGGQPWFDYLSARKTHLEQFVTDAVRAAVPNRDLYLFYPTEGPGERNLHEFWWWWGWDYAQFRTVSDLPSNSRYYGQRGTWTSDIDMLSQVLNSTAQEIAAGDPLSYNWVCGGLYTNSVSDDAHYMGFLKCWYTAGMIGGIAGDFNYPPGGYGAELGTNMPCWLSNMVVLGHTHALFSYLEEYLRKGYLLPGPNRHRWSTDLPAYEFPAGDPQARVLVRKHRNRTEWIITAWAAGGSDRMVTAMVPELGAVNVLARSCGSVYFALPGPTLTLLDPDGMLPSQQLSADTFKPPQSPDPPDHPVASMFAFKQISFKNGTFSGFIEKLGGSISLKISSNLLHWQTVTNFSGGAGTIFFQDVIGTNADRRFYRSSSP